MASSEPLNHTRISWHPIDYQPRAGVRSAASPAASDRWSWISGASSAFEAKSYCESSFSSVEHDNEDEDQDRSQRQPDSIHLEAGGAPWGSHGWGPKLGFLRRGRFRSRIDKKLRDPSSDRAIHYRIRPKLLCKKLFFRFSFFYCLCVLVGIFHSQLGLNCGGPPDDSHTVVPPPQSLLQLRMPRMFDVDTGSSSDSTPNQMVPALQQPEHSLLHIFLPVAIMGIATYFLTTHGMLNIRGARTALEKVRCTAGSLAYRFLKTTAANETGSEAEALQLIVYECLALITAYPVALLQQLYSNTCEPDVTRYCREVAVAFQRMRDGGSQDAERLPGPKYPYQAKHFATVDHFFEIFSLQLEKEFRGQSKRGGIPSMAPQHIIYNLRNHLENLVDIDWIDDRKAPLLRENIDMYGYCGRECSIYGFYDILPASFLFILTTMSYFLALCVPLTQCELFASPTSPSPDDTFPTPTVSTFVYAAVVSAICVTGLILVDEVRGFWNPYGRGINMFAWSLSIAMEIDMMVNEFYEWDEAALLRPNCCYAARDSEMGERGQRHEKRAVAVQEGVQRNLQRALTV